MKLSLHPIALVLLWMTLLMAIPVRGGDPAAAIRSTLLGEAILGDGAYAFLEHISDHYGHRMIGTESHEETMAYLEKLLREAGLETRRQTFSYPGWVRQDSRATLLEPLSRALRAEALGYVGSFAPVRAKVAYVEAKDISDFNGEEIRGRILLVRENVSYSHEDMLTLFKDHAVKGLLYINRVNGGQLLARAANRSGEETPFPVFSITQEEGLWMKRMLEKERPLLLELETRSEVRTMTGVNLIATLPGESGERVLLGGHFDSWDLGQGAIDNGVGVAQILEVARILKKHRPVNRHTVEFVWFDAEEFGLWGSRHYAETTDVSDIRAMVNLDMVGRPIAVNAMGFDELVPELEAYTASLGAWEFTQKVANKPWLGSDHHPFILRGVPAITFNAPMKPEDVRYYHDFADTFDKVDRQMLGESTGLIALLVHDLANSADPRPRQLDQAETAELFRKAGLEERMRQADSWPFEEADQEEP